VESWIGLFLPFALLLGRIGAFFAVLPIFGWRALPMRVRAGIALLVTVFFAIVAPGAVPPGHAHWLAATVLLVREILCGLALGLAASFVFLAVQQGGRIAAIQMGFAEAGIIDPGSREQERPIAMFLEMTFALFFLAAGGHRLLLTILARSYQAFPVGAVPAPGELAEGLIRAGSTMLVFGLKLAAPVLAAFLILAVVLAVLARVLPEMNVLLTSLPMRVGLGLFMAAAIVPSLHSFTLELARWMKRFLIP
jgi:flagellar biosynthetic protein FliR